MSNRKTTTVTLTFERSTDKQLRPTLEKHGLMRRGSNRTAEVVEDSDGKGGTYYWDFNDDKSAKRMHQDLTTWLRTKNWAYRSRYEVESYKND